MYWFQDNKNQIVYVGKAKNLKNRITSYKHLNQLEGKTKRLVTTAAKLKFKIVDTEIDALILEAQLIKLHQPQFNIRLKDDKSPLYLYITTDAIPQIKTIRSNQIHQNIKKANLFGPYASSFELKKLLIYLRKTFRYCQATPTQIANLKACFYYHLSQCPGICAGIMTVQDYQAHMDSIKLFLKGGKQQIIKQLKIDIKDHIKFQEFERAQQIKLQIQTLELKASTKYKYDKILPIISSDFNEETIKLLRRILRKFYSLPTNYPLSRIEGYDISNIQGKWATGSMVTFENGESQKSQYRKFRIKTKSTPDDPYMMTEMLSRRIKHPEWGIPNLILIDGGKTQISAAQKTIPWNIPIISLVKRPERLLIKKDDKYYFVPLGEDLASNLLRRIRDESHRFAKAYHKRLTLNF